MDTGGAGGRMNWEPGSDTCTAMCKAEGRNLLWITGSSAWCAVTMSQMAHTSVSMYRSIEDITTSV